MDMKYRESMVLLFGENGVKSSTASFFITQSELRRAYYSKAKRFHPDRSAINGEDPAEQSRKFKMIADAYNYLLKYRSQKHCFNNNSSNRDYYSAKAGFYKGNIPLKQLRFAEYLYYKGIISWNDLIASICWQVRNRPKFGDIAKNLNFIDSNTLKELICEPSVNKKIGERAIEREIINYYQLFVILGMQKKVDMPIGRYFILKGIITNDQAQKLNKELQNRNLTFV